MRIEELPGHNELNEYSGQIIRTPVMKLAIIPEDETEVELLPDLALHIKKFGARVFYTMNSGEVEQREVKSVNEGNFVCRDTPVLIIETSYRDTGEEIALAVKRKETPKPRDVSKLHQVRNDVAGRVESVKRDIKDAEDMEKTNVWKEEFEGRKKAYEIVLNIIDRRL